MTNKDLLIIVMLLIAATLPTSFAQDNTQVGLPEGAIARLGKGGINIMRFSPDGTHLAVGTDVGVWLYDVPDGKETVLYTEHATQVNTLAFSPDGNMLASSGDEKSLIHLWDLEENIKHKTLTPNDNHRSIMAIIFHGRTLICLDSIGQIDFWNIETGENVLNLGTELWKHIPYQPVVFQEDKKTFATGHRNGNIRIWDATTGKLRSTLRGHASLFGNSKLLQNNVIVSQDKEVTALAFSHDGKTIASGGFDKKVILWDTKTRKKITTFEGHNGWINVIAFSRDGRIIASGDAKKVIKIWNVATKQESISIDQHNSGICALGFSPDGKMLASGSYDGTIRLWNPETGGEIAKFASGHVEWIKAIAFSENGTTLASASFNGIVDIWSLKTKRELMTFSDGQNDIVEKCLFSPDAMNFATRGGTGMVMFSPHGYRSEYRSVKGIKLWEIFTGKKIPTIRLSNGGRATAVAFAVDKKTIAYGNSQEIIIYDTESNNKLCILKPKRPVGRRKLLFSPDNSLLATYGTNVRTQIWNTDTQQDITPQNTGNDRTDLLAFSPDSTSVAIKNPYNIVLSKVTPTEIREHKLIHDSVSGIRNILLFSPDGKYLIAPRYPGTENTIQIWDVETGIGFRIVTGHHKPIETLAFSHDGKTLASGSKDGTVLLWDWNKLLAYDRPDKIEQIQWKKNTEVVIMWLKQNQYQFKIEGDQFVLRKKNGGSSSIGTHGMGHTMHGDVHVKTDGAGSIRISINRIGVADFFFDKNGNLQPLNASHPNE